MIETWSGPPGSGTGAGWPPATHLELLSGGDLAGEVVQDGLQIQVAEPANPTATTGHYTMRARPPMHVRPHTRKQTACSPPASQCDPKRKNPGRMMGGAGLAGP